jgi:nucleoid DNA-binding protein
MAKKKAVVAAKAAAPVKSLTKTDLCKAIAADVGDGRPATNVASVLKALANVVAVEVKRSGVVTIPGVVKLTARARPATPARKGVDPFTKQEKMFQAKPATTVLKARPAKVLRDAVSARK